MRDRIKWKIVLKINGEFIGILPNQKEACIHFTSLYITTPSTPKYIRVAA